MLAIEMTETGVRVLRWTASFSASWEEVREARLVLTWGKMREVILKSPHGSVSINAALVGQAALAELASTLRAQMGARVRDLTFWAAYRPFLLFLVFLSLAFIGCRLLIEQWLR